MKIVSPELSKFKEISSLVAECEGLVAHDNHFYKIILNYFGNSSFIAIDDNRVLGWVFGFKSQFDPNIFFLWQLGVHPKVRRRGVGLQLIERLIEVARGLGSTKMRSTVIRENVASRDLFEKCGFNNISESKENFLTDQYGPYIPNYYAENEDLVLYELDLGFPA